MPNTELLKRTLQHIETHPKLWVQESWSTETKCGTAYCFAGWALALSGVPMVDNSDEVAIADLNKALPPERPYVPAVLGDQKAYVAHAAEWLLGLEDMRLRDLDDDEVYRASSTLFEASNSLDYLRHYVAELCGETETAVS